LSLKRGIGLLLVVALAYGVLIPWLGYYWDDWLVFAEAHMGPGFEIAERQFRPLLWDARTATLGLLGERPLGWHLLALLARGLLALAFGWTASGLWPERRLETAAASLLFAVYPGFSGQPLAAIYSHVLLQFAIHLASFGAMVHGLRRPRLMLPMTLLALGLLALSLLLSEYFVGLELLRPALLWMAMERSPDRPAGTWRAVLRRWSPYMAPLAIYVIWRFAFSGAPESYDPALALGNALNHPIAALASRARIILADLVSLGPMAWAQVLGPDLLPEDDSQRAVVLSWAVSAAVAAVAAAVLRSRRPGLEGAGAGIAWGREAFGLGLVASCLGQLPLWLAGRGIRLGTLFDRYGLPAAVGSSLAAAGLIFLLVRTRRQQAACVAILVGLAAGVHVRNANQYRLDWAAQRSFFWQLSWRLPDPPCGARLLVSTGGQAMAYTSDHALAVPVNWMFPRHRGPCELQVRGGSGAVRPGEGVTADYRPPACLRVAAPAPPPASSAAAVPEEVFGAEPAHGWCFFFQQAELARARGDGKALARWGEEVRRRGLGPADDAEWTAFLGEDL